MKKLSFTKTLIASTILLTSLGLSTLSVTNTAYASPSSNAFVNAQLVSNGVPSLAPMIKEVLPSVVSIRVKAVEKVANNNPFPNNFFSPLLPKEFQNLFGNNFGFPQAQEQRNIIAAGSGVIINADKGYVLTNNHVIQGAKVIQVTLYDNRVYTAHVVGVDPDTDLAVIQLNKFSNLKAIQVGNSNEEQIGDFVVAIGNPFGIGLTATAGIVSALNRSAQLSLYSNYIQTDAAINHGNSGGALVNLKGQLIGINTAIVSDSGGSDGVGFAIPSNIALRIADQLIANGRVIRGQIGIRGTNLSPQLEQALKLNVSEGAFVSEVLPNTPAQKAGLKAGDVIVKLNGNPIVDFNQLRAIIGSSAANTTFQVTYIRDGKEYTTSITSAASKDNKQANKPAVQAPTETISLFGATFGQTSNGLVVENVKKDSTFGQYGIEKGDVLVQVQGVNVSTIDQLNKVLKDNQNANVLVYKFSHGPNNFIYITLSNGY